MRIAVTGATGFVGRALVADGAAAGHTMVAVVREGSPGVAPSVGAPAIETRRIADLADAAGLRAAFDAVDVVVHAAARVHVMHAEGPDAIERFRAVNVHGTRAVAAAARAAGARRLIVLSTAKVLGEGRASSVLRDAGPLAPEGAYAQSKAEMELELAASPSADWTIIRPPLVYGPGVGGNFRRLLQLASLARVVPLPLGGVRNRRSMVYVGNLTSAILRAAADERARGRRFLVSDGEDLATPDLVRRLARAAGSRALVVPFPVPLLRAPLGAIGRGAEAERLLDSFVVDSGAIRRALDWVPPFTVDAGLAETVRWWKAS